MEKKQSTKTDEKRILSKFNLILHRHAVVQVSRTILKSELKKRKIPCEDIPGFKRTSLDSFTDRAPATKTVDSGSTSCRVKPKTKKNWYLQLPCLAFSTKNDT